MNMTTKIWWLKYWKYYYFFDALIFFTWYESKHVVRVTWSSHFYDSAEMIRYQLEWHKVCIDDLLYEISEEYDTPPIKKCSWSFADILNYDTLTFFRSSFTSEMQF